MGYVNGAGPNVNEWNTTTEGETGGEPRIPAIVVTSGRRAVGVSPITCLVAQTAVVAKLVVPENDFTHDSRQAEHRQGLGIGTHRFPGGAAGL